jgi:hypothetical protein
MRHALRILALALVFAAVARVARGQSAAQLIADARQQIDNLNWDSASVVLQRALQRRPSEAERVRVFTLLGITQLSRDDRVGARSAFEQALRLDASLRVDTLAELHTDVRLVFGEARAALGITDAPRAAPAAAPFAVGVDVPADTTLPAIGGRLRIVTRPSYRARVVVAISAADAPTVLFWSDTATVGGVGTRAWDLRVRDGSLVAPGRYSLRATATDSIGQVAPTIERILVISRIATDTTPLPAPLAESAFAPESRRLALGSPSGLLVGLLFGAAAAFLPSGLGRTELDGRASSDETALAVGGTIAVAGVVAFLAGHRVQSIPENIQRNRELRERDAATRAAIVHANARAVQSAPVRVRLEGAAP